MDLKRFIVKYDGVLDDNLCKNAIEYFNQGADSITRIDNEMCGFSCINLTEEVEVKHNNIWNPIHQQVLLAIKATGERYMKDVNCEPYWPRQNSLEQVKMIKYQHKTADRFDRHIDVGDYNSARRFLTIQMYLNDVEEGGETFFNDLDLKVPSQRGSIVLFPATWTYPHSYLAPIGEDKYALTTYLHYT